jgi:hypothetical protein
MIRYEMNQHYGGACWFLWRNGAVLTYGTWRECAEKLRELHPGAKLKVKRPCPVDWQAASDFFSALPL